MLTYASDSVFDHLYYSRGSKGGSAAEAERGTSSLLEEAEYFSISVVERPSIMSRMCSSCRVVLLWLR